MVVIVIVVIIIGIFAIKILFEFIKVAILKFINFLTLGPFLIFFSTGYILLPPNKFRETAFHATEYATEILEIEWGERRMVFVTDNMQNKAIIILVIFGI